jgi:glutamine amidotransferase
LKNIGILNYGAGNLGSIYNAILYLGGNPIIVESAEALNNVESMVLPGVGSFDAAITKIEQVWGIEAIRKKISSVPTLAICLGMHLLFDKSEEGTKSGLSLQMGQVRMLNSNEIGERVPNIGWSRLQSNIFNQPTNAEYYFNHSYALPEAPNGVSHTLFPGFNNFVSSLNFKTVTAYQFHPEKSGDRGLDLIESFIAGNNE